MNCMKIKNNILVVFLLDNIFIFRCDTKKTFKLKYNEELEKLFLRFQKGQQFCEEENIELINDLEQAGVIAVDRG